MFKPSLPETETTDWYWGGGVDFKPSSYILDLNVYVAKRAGEWDNISNHAIIFMKRNMPNDTQFFVLIIM